MSLEGVLLPLVSGIIGWALRHYGILQPAQGTPQSRPSPAATVPTAGAQADLPSMIGSVVSAEIRKLMDLLDARLPAQSSAKT